MTSSARARVGAAALLLAIASGCLKSEPPQRPEQGEDAVVLFRCEPADAEVWVDGRFVARVADFAGGMALAPGTHRVIVRHEDFHAAYVELKLEPAERRTVAIPLAPKYTASP